MTHQNWEKAVADFITQKQNETVSLIERLGQNIRILEDQKEKATVLIHILEEAGGLTVRARNMMTTPEDSAKYSPQIKEVEEWFRQVRSKFDKAALESGIDGINLMNGDRLETNFDPKGQNKLITAGMILSCNELGIRLPDFSTSFTTQNARIDVMNAIDIVVTIRNTISAHMNDLTINQDFAIHAVELAKTSYAALGSSNTNTETQALIKLGILGDKILGDEKMADPIQQEILNSFAAPFPDQNIEDI
jgi:hypothetical protein